MTKTGKLILNNSYDKSLLYYPKTAEERKAVSQYSWANEDYRQLKVDNIEGAISKPDEYMPFYFRHISATIVGAYTWKATEFSEKVLKAAKDKLRHKPVYVNHELEISNIVGVNGDINFVPKSIAEDNTEIPAGLDGPIWIDARLHKDLCRKLTGYPVPHIQSVSVTVTYNWEPSHTFTSRDGQPDDWEFEMRIGTLVDGTMVRRVVTEIVDFYETSLVFLGSDPFAKILDINGKPINIEKESIVGAANFDKDPLVDLYKNNNLMIIESNNELTEKNILHLNKEIISSFSKTGKYLEKKEKVQEMSKELLSVLAKAFNKEEGEITPELIASYKMVKVEEYEKLKDAETALQIEKANAIKLQKTIDSYSIICKDEELVELEKEVALNEVVAYAKFGKKVLSAKKEECIRLYKLSIGEGKESQAVIDTINKSNEEVVDGFLKQYGSAVTETYSGECSKCGSKDISFRSSKSEGEESHTAVIEETKMAERYRG